MAYTTSAEVQGDFKNITFSESTLVTSAKVTQFIVEADALINSYVGMKYSTPVTESGEGLSLLKLYSRTLVSDRIKKIMEVKTERNTDANQSARGGFGTKDVMAGLLLIKNGDMKLDGATALVSNSGFSSYNDTNEIEPTFQKSEKQW